MLGQIMQLSSVLKRNHWCVVRNYEEHRPNQEKMIGGIETGGRRSRRAPDRFEFKANDTRAAEGADLQAMQAASGTLRDTMHVHGACP